MDNYPVEPGNYYIVPVVANSTHAIDIPGAVIKDGTIVMVGPRTGVSEGAGTDAQSFNVSYRTDGTVQLASYFSGKSLDVPGGTIIPTGMNVEIWTDNDTRAQQWGIEPTNETITIDEVVYSTYYICLTADTEYRMTTDTSQWTNWRTLEVRKWNSTAETSRREYYKWIFMPVPVFRSGGLYDIAPRHALNMRVDVAYMSTQNGANVQSHTKNDTNAQKFVLLYDESSTGWRIRNIGSSKYIDVATVANGQNVVSWELDPSRAQLWKIDMHSETAVVDGITCPIVRFGGGNALSYCMDVEGASTSSGANVFLHDSIGQHPNQLFALKPTNATDTTMPIPYNIGVAEYLLGNISDTIYISASNVEQDSLSVRQYPAWYSAESWANSGGQSFQWCYSTRSMLLSNSSWGTQTEFSAYQTALVTRSGNRFDITQGFEFTLSENEKAKEYIFKVRPCGPDSLGLNLLVGPEAVQTVMVYRKPDVTLTDPTITKDGLVYSYDKNYLGGMISVAVDSITDQDTGTVYLDSSYKVRQDDSSTTLTIPYYALKNIPRNGAKLVTSVRIGTDLYEPTSEHKFFNGLLVSYAASSDISVLYDDAEAHMLRISVPNTVQNAQVYMITDQIMYKCDKANENTLTGYIDYMIPYPFGIPYDILVTGTNGDTWYLHRETLAKRSVSLHAWNYNGVGCVLECRPDRYLSTNVNIGVDHTSQSLNNREWQYTQLGVTKNAKFTAEGALVPGHTESTYLDFENLVGKHALYRSVSGDICNVAVTDISRETDYLYSKVTVTMNKESL